MILVPILLAMTLMAALGVHAHIALGTYGHGQHMHMRVGFIEMLDDAQHLGTVTRGIVPGEDDHVTAPAQILSLVHVSDRIGKAEHAGDHHVGVAADAPQYVPPVRLLLAQPTQQLVLFGDALLDQRDHLRGPDAFEDGGQLRIPDMRAGPVQPFGLIRDLANGPALAVALARISLLVREDGFPATLRHNAIPR